MNTPNQPNQRKPATPVPANTPTAPTPTPATAGGAAAPLAALEKTERRTKLDVLREDLQSKVTREQIVEVLPAHLKATLDRVIRVGMNIFRNNPKLWHCTVDSFKTALLQCAELGLDPSPLLQECAFVPYVNRKDVQRGNQWTKEDVKEVQLQTMYLGLIKLSKQTGEISDIYAVTVDAAELELLFDVHHNLIRGFRFWEGTERRIEHVRQLSGRSDRLVGVYGVVKFRDGTHHFEVLREADVHRARDRSRGYAYAISQNPVGDSPWISDTEAMWRKTALRQVLKTVPKSADRLALAMERERVQDDLLHSDRTILHVEADADGVVDDEIPALAEPTASAAEQFQSAGSRMEELAEKLEAR